MEAAALLELPDALWYQEFYLREREMGLFEIMLEDDKKTKYEECGLPQMHRQASICGYPSSLRLVHLQSRGSHRAP
jgi:hypothetical protein